MDRTKWSAGASQDEWQDDPFKTAESVAADFEQLVAVFDRRLANLSDADFEAQRHLLEAKAAAERGQRLSHELVKLLRSPD